MPARPPGPVGKDVFGAACQSPEKGAIIRLALGRAAA
jgi:hypothetical protein